MKITKPYLIRTCGLIELSGLDAIEEKETDFTEFASAAGYELQTLKYQWAGT